MSELLPQKNSDTELVFPESSLAPVFERALRGVRDELRESPYILEAMRVLPVKGYRSAIGNFWNAVIDDLRNKVIHRSLPLFNKSVAGLRQQVKSYEDFQQFVNDDELIEGAYKIGVIGYEAFKILKHAKETRHFFDGHPRSSDPSAIKVLAMMDDCIKYVLSAPNPAQIIDIDEYMSALGTPTFDRNELSIEYALTELPEIYKNELANRLFTTYIHPGSSSTIRANIEFVVPILWRVLPKKVQLQITQRVDQEIPKGNVECTELAFTFVRHVKATPYLSLQARRYKLQPLIAKLSKGLDKWTEEASAVRDILPFASVIPVEFVPEYVLSLMLTYVGYTGSSFRFSRSNFYSDEAAQFIPGMFELFDEKAAEAFVAGIKGSDMLKRRIEIPDKLARLRSLGNIVLGRVSADFIDRSFLEALCDQAKEEEFWRVVRKKG